jgi:hypothetical protein
MSRLQVPLTLGLLLALLLGWALYGRVAGPGVPAPEGQALIASPPPELLYARECFYRAQMQINLVEAEMTQPFYDHDTSEFAAREARKAADRLRLVSVTSEGHWLLESGHQGVLFDPERRDFLTEGYSGCGALMDSASR